MWRLFFFLLLLANIAFGAHLYLSATAPKESLVPEVNRDALNIVSAIDPAKAQVEASESKKFNETLAGAACIAFTVKPADAARAQSLLAGMGLGARLESRNVEEITRYGVIMPVQRDKKAAETLVASLKRAGVTDVLQLADNAVSLGIFSTEETATRHLGEIRAKARALLESAVVAPRGTQVRETIFTVKAPDANLVSRLSLMQRDFAVSTLKATTCPVPPKAAVVSSDAI